MPTRNRLLKGWEVEWCAGCPVVDGDTDLDNADMRFADFSNKADAMKFAEKMLEVDFFGSVRVTQFEMVPFEPGYPGLTREYVGEPDYVDGSN